MDFLANNRKPGEKIIIYGYSYGGDFAVELAEKLKESNTKVDLLVTVDASDGPLQESTVNTTIPDSVRLIKIIIKQIVQEHLLIRNIQIARIIKVSLQLHLVRMVGLIKLTTLLKLWWLTIIRLARK